MLSMYLIQMTKQIQVITIKHYKEIQKDERKQVGIQNEDNCGEKKKL